MSACGLSLSGPGRRRAGAREHVPVAAVRISSGPLRGVELETGVTRGPRRLRLLMRALRPGTPPPRRGRPPQRPAA